MSRMPGIAVARSPHPVPPSEIPAPAPEVQSRSADAVLLGDAVVLAAHEWLEVGREVVAQPAPDGATLVIDRIQADGADPRLVARLEPDEPTTNAVLVCGVYLADARRSLPRPVEDPDLAGQRRDGRRGDEDPWACLVASPAEAVALVDAGGAAHALEPVTLGPTEDLELRWVRRPPQGGRLIVSVREAVGHLEDYAAVYAITDRALSAFRGRPGVSVRVLAAELQRVQSSRIVLNRALREAVVSAVARQGLSMSEIAIRCGRTKRDARGKLSGETSWLGRRLGLLPEGGQSTPTPWIHSDVLDLIASLGIGLCPGDVELG